MVKVKYGKDYIINMMVDINKYRPMTCKECPEMFHPFKYRYHCRYTGARVRPNKPPYHHCPLRNMPLFAETEW